jgi:hypothetical protein
MASNPWMRLPSAWIRKGQLTRLSWHYRGKGADNTAALMALTAIAHAVDEENGVARITYDRLCEVTGLSRAKLSNGLVILKNIEILRSCTQDARSTYELADYNSTSGWAKFPVKSMYAAGRIVAFDDFRLRKAVELDALKLFFLFVAYRDNGTNMATIGYEKINKYSGVKKERIKSAISFLASLSLVYVEQVPSRINAYGVSNAYRIVGIDPFNHRGTRSRNMDDVAFSE